jgi:hypothetical protein
MSFVVIYHKQSLILGFSNPDYFRNNKALIFVGKN